MTNPHYAKAEELRTRKLYLSDVAQAQIEATLAVAWETARLADEARTANIIASMNLVEMSDGTTAKIQPEAATRRLGEIKSRIDPEGATK